MEEIEGSIHIVMFWIAYEGEITEIEIDLVLNHRSLLTVHEPGWDPFTLPQLRGDPANVLRRGPDFLLYALTDGIVDAYFPVLDAIEDEIDALQDDVIARPNSWTLERLFALKRAAHRPPPRHVAGPRDLQPAHQPGPRPGRSRSTSSTSATCTTTSSA